MSNNCYVVLKKSQNALKWKQLIESKILDTFIRLESMRIVSLDEYWYGE